ncbi:hypothetical protein [uncultured Rikenella sp.]|uniref:hypothetical protein n=1 Tax=uncultured Rikenella sp. TaxID=368003 RepID=UPI0025EC8F40|nr:hypothetical protein [uncultured Rikenella sp.]
MDASEYVKAVRTEILTDDFNYYLNDLFSDAVSTEDWTDQSWIESHKLYLSLNEEQKKQLKICIKLMMRNVISTIFSKFDNVSCFEEQGGDFEVRLNNKVISGDLQDLFWAQEEEEEEEGK